MLKRNWTSLFVAVALLAGICVEPSAAQQITITVKPDDETQVEGKAPFTGTRPAADVAILLDTSNSMDGLISQAKSQLWNIVQQFAAAKMSGKTPALRVAVFEYGNSGLPASEGYIRQALGLTDDLDKVSEVLFALKTNGGDEYCGTVIAEALKRLDWSNEPNAYKSIFIAGNEPFTQGQVDYKQSCKSAIQNGVLVNTIHCGDYSAGVSGYWQHGAQLAEGEFMNINQDKAVVSIKTPHDRILIELNEKLNRTYMWFGKKESRGSWAANQLAQDNNALQSQGAGGLSSRAAVKGSSIYSNVGRDLVDTFKSNSKIMEEIDQDELPDELQALPAPRRVEVVREKTAERDALQKQIAELTKKRNAFVENEKKKLASADTAGSTLGDAIQTAVTKQMKSAGFEFSK